MVSCDVYLACTGSPVVESEDEDAVRSQTILVVDI
jgi:hypothetical protein